MISYKNLEPPVLETFGIGKRIQSASFRRLQIPDKPSDITETFEIWTLSAAIIRRVRTPPANFSNLERMAVNTERLHHQIKLGGKKIAYGRSEMIRDADTLAPSLKFKGLFVSHKAKKIDDLFSWAKENLQNIDVEARLLLAPEYQVTTFWILGSTTRPEGIVPVHFPREFNRYFMRTRLVPSETFLDALYTVGPIEGIRWESSD